MKNVLITGANRGIGLGLVKRFLENDFQVIATYRQEHTSQELLDLAKNKKNLALIKMDLNNDSDYLQLKNTVKPFKEIHYLINNAGIIGGETRSLFETSPSEVLEVFKNNTLNPMKICQTVIPFLAKNAVVTQITSMMGSIKDNQSGGYYDYRISKAALNMLHKCLSLEFKDFTFLTLHPGWVQTDMGGAQAPTSVEESTKGLFSVITGKTPRQSGQFLNYQGQELPW